MSSFTLPLESLEVTLEVAGGKGVSLSHLARARFPVPLGFILTTTAYEAFVASSTLQHRIVELACSAPVDDLASLEEVSRAIRGEFEQAPLPEAIAAAIRQAYRDLIGAVDNRPISAAAVAEASEEHQSRSMQQLALAVRSSATAEDLPVASFAGQQETYLNVRGEAALLTAVRRCWSSLWTAHAIAYRARLGIEPAAVRQAVVVQHLVPAEAAGVLFTVHPVTGDPDEVVINAAWGLGEAVVGGRVTPDTVMVDRASGQVKRADIADKTIMTIVTAESTADVPVEAWRRRRPVLSPEQAAELTRLGRELATHFDGPQDIEWAITGGRVFILQSRPVTVLPRQGKPSVAQRAVPGDDAWPALGEWPAQPFDLWTQTNVGEIWSEPVTPLTWFTIPIGINQGIRSSLVGLQAPYLDRIQWVKRFYGRIYFNEGALAHIFSSEYCLPPSFIDTALGSRRAADQIADGGVRLAAFVRRLPTLLPIWLRRGPVRREARRQLEALVPQVDQWVTEFLARDLAGLTDRELRTDREGLWRERTNLVRKPYYLMSAYAMTDYALLRSIAERWGGGADVAHELVSGLSGVFVAEMAIELWTMARMLDGLQLAGLVLDNRPEVGLSQLRASPAATPVLERLEAFLQRHGHRSTSRDFVYPRWREAPEQIIEMVAGYLRAGDQVNPSEASVHQRKRREAATARMEASLARTRRRIFRSVLNNAQNDARWRDNGRHYLEKVQFPRVLIDRELARRWAERGWLRHRDDFFFLTRLEIQGVIEAGEPTAVGLDLSRLVNERRAARHYWFQVEAPEVIGPDGQPILDWSGTPSGSVLEGIPACSGEARGPARIVYDARKAAQLQAGDILVTRSTDSSWTPVFPLLGGLVLEVGGQLSHGAIVAREYGVPAIVNVPNATRYIRDGQTIAIDAATGRIHLQPPAER